MKKTNNKGFSLVELIIVIAIMAILVGAIAPALIRYIDKSRKSNDVSACKTIKTAIETAMANEDAYEELVGDGSKDTVLQIVPNKALSITAASGGSNSGVIVVKASTTTISDDTINEIAKNIGDKSPKISYKKAGKKVTVSPKNYYAVITGKGSIFVGIGDSAATAAKYDDKGKVTNTDWYVIVPDTCDDYK